MITGRFLVSVRTDGTDERRIDLLSTLGGLTAIDGGYGYYWGVVLDGGAQSGIYRVRLDASAAPTLLIPDTLSGPIFAVADGAIVDTNDDLLMRAALDGTQPVALATIGRLSNVAHIVNRTVYVGSSLVGGAVDLRSRSAGPPTILATVPTTGPHEVLNEGASIYRRADTAIYAVEAGGPRPLAVASDLGGMVLVPGQLLYFRSGYDGRVGQTTSGSIRVAPR